MISNLFKQKCSLTKLREELEGRKGKLCRCCKKFGHLAHNCRNVKEEKGKAAPLNKFEILSSRVMQSRDEGRMTRRIKAVVVMCYKCGEKGHKCRECPLWEKKVKEVTRPVEGKVHQGERRRLVRPEKRKAQEGERKLRRAEKEEAAHMAKPQEAQQG